VTAAVTGSSFTSQGTDITYTPGTTGISLAAGIWDVVVSVDWGTPNAAGYRQVTLTDGDTFSISNQVASAGSSGDTVQQLSWMGQLTETTTLYVEVTQNSGSLLVVVPDNSCYITGAKIG
jgi:hypothetical protein